MVRFQIPTVFIHKIPFLKNRQNLFAKNGPVLLNVEGRKKTAKSLYEWIFSSPIFHVNKRLECGVGDHAVVEDVPAAVLVVASTNILKAVGLKNEIKVNYSGDPNTWHSKSGNICKPNMLSRS